MKSSYKFVVILGMLSTATMAETAGRHATAILNKTDGTAAGKATFKDRPDGVWMTVEASGLPAGAHGIHLHMTGSCKAPDFASAAGHWNPMGKKHGLESPDGAHMGDLPNLMVGADGKGKLETLVKGAHLDSSATGLLDSDGTALVIHAGPDDNHTDPSGNSGGRIACGVVTES